jgi:hypothetical protein
MLGLVLGVLGLGSFISRGGHGTRRTDLGLMSQRWLAEHRAGSR